MDPTIFASAFTPLLNIASSDTMYQSMIRFAVVLAFAAVGELVAERAGTLNISAEAMLISGAFTGAVVSDHTGHIAFGLIFGMLAGVIVAAIQANLSHRLTIDQFVVGLTLNLFVLGLALFLDARFKPQTNVATKWRVPGLANIPIIGEALYGQPWPMYLILPTVGASWYLLFRTRWGLEVRAVGENPQSADVTGIHVNRRRRQSIYFAGLCSGLGGAVLVLAQIPINGFEAGHVGLKGIIAIGAVIFGGWTLRGTLFGCLIFGYFFALQQALPSIGYTINSQLSGALPYLAALAVTSIFAARTRQPRALAQPFTRGLT